MTMRQAGIRLKIDGKTEVKRDLQDVGETGQKAGQAIEGAFDQAGKAATAADKAAERQLARWKEMAKAAREYASQQDQQARFNAVLGVDGGGGKSALSSAEVFAASGGRLTRGQRAGRLNLVRQGADVFTTAAMGMDPAMIAIQQGPQILDALATSGLKASATMIAVGASVATAAVAVGGLVAAGVAYENQALKMVVATQGLGRASAMSSEQLQEAARIGAEAGDLSARSARDIGIAYAETGKIGSSVMAGLIGLTRNYALTTGQDAASATKELGRAFADPVKGVADLNDRLHFLDAAEQRHIQNMARAGDEAGAQREMVRRLQDALLDASSATTGWAQAWDRVKVAASNAGDAIGHFVAVGMGGGNNAEKLTELLRGRNLAAVRGFSTAEYDRDIAALRARMAKVAELQQQARQNQRSTDRQALVDQYNPNPAKLAGLRADREKMLGLGVAASDPAVKALDAEIRALSSGYKTAGAYAAALARQNRSAAVDAKRDAREAQLDARKAADLDVQRLRGVVEIAKAKNDPSAVDLAERELRVRELIIQLERDGLTTAKAKLEAQRQVAAEMLGEYQALLLETSDRQMVKQGFISSGERMAKAQAGADIMPYNAKTAFIEGLRVESGSAFHDGLIAGMSGGSFWDTFRDRLRYAAASGLADALTTGLFGKKDGGSSGLFTAAGRMLTSVFAKHSAGTRYAPGGLSWVGEHGPELVDLKRGAGVYNASESEALAARFARDRDQLGMAMARPAAPVTAVSVTFAPVYQVQGGTTEDIERLQAQIVDNERTFAERVTHAVNDGLQRRLIRG
jgi:phage-related minor tail protein